MIYAIRAVGTEFIKFGYTDDRAYKRRIEALQTGCPFELEQLALCGGDRKAEIAVHHRLFQAGAHHRGEWFKDCPEARAVIAEMLGGRLKSGEAPLDPLRVWNRKVNNLAEIGGREPGGWVTSKEPRVLTEPHIPMLPAEDTNERYDHIKRNCLSRKARRAASKAPRAAGTLQSDTCPA